MASLAADADLLAAPLMQAPPPRSQDTWSSLTDATKLHAVTYTARAFFDYVTSLSSEQIGYFCGADIKRLVMMIILAYRLSFPMPAYPSYDYVQGRKVLDFGTHLAKMSTIDDDEGSVGKDGGDGRAGGGSKKVDAVAALKVVLGSLRAKFDKKSAELEAAATAAAEESNRRARMCPMLDGSLDQYLPLWEGQQTNNFAGSSYATSSHSGGYSAALPADSVISPSDVPQYPVAGSGPEKPMLFHDLWATMTMGWATDMDMQQGSDNVTGVEDTEGCSDLTGL